MPLTLAELPIEILCQVTSFVPSKDVLEILLGIGNQLLASKLHNGGISELRIDPLKLSNAHLSSRHISLAHSLSLRSLILLRADPRAQVLVMGLKATLRSLSTPLEALLQAGLNLHPIPPFSGCDRAPWIVSATFPRLEVLHLHGTYVLDLRNPASTLQFLLGLPSSLTALTLPPMAEFNYWHHLPPFLTELNGVGCFTFPPSPLPANLASLQTCTLQSFANASVIASPPWTCVSDLRDAAIPPNLTSFALKCIPTDLEQLMRLPSSLTSLTISLIPKPVDFQAFYHPSALLRVLPPNLTRLNVGCFRFSADDARKVSDHAIRPAVKLVEVIFHSYSSVDPVADASTLTYIIDCLPNVESLTLERVEQFNSAPLGLGAEHIARINGQKLRFLKTCLRNSALTSAEDGTYPLQKLVALRTLVCCSQIQFHERTFTFEAFPPSVTHLDTQNNCFSMETLHLLPKSVTTIGGTLRVPETELFNPIFYHPPKALQPAFSSGSAPFHIPNEPQTFDFSPCFALNRIGAENGDQTKSKIVLESLANEGVSLAKVHSLVVKLQIPDVIAHFPTTLTYLDVALVTQYPLTASALPALAYLRIIATTNLDLSEFTNLVSLEINSISTGTLVGNLPPNLTRLSAATIKITEELLPLPLSLTQIESEKLIGTLSALTPLVNLQIFKCDDPTSEETELLQSLPRKSLRHLDVGPKTLESSLSLPQSIWETFPALETIVLRLAHELATLDSLYRSMPQYASINVCEPVRVLITPLELAKFAKIPLGSILFDHGNIECWCRDMLSKTYPRLKSDVFSLHIRWIASENEKEIGTWSEFASYLSPAIPRLFLDQVFVDTKFASSLPRGLKELTISGHRDFALDPSSELPPGLTSLKADVLSCEAGFIARLPRGLTILALGRITKISLNSSLLWPSGLLELKLKLRYTGIDHWLLSYLPQSLVKLSIRNIALQACHLASLPAGLKYVEMRLDDVDLETLEGAGLTLFSRSVPYDLDFSPMLDRALEGSRPDLLAAKPTE